MDCEVLSNFHPVSNLPFLSKIFEKVVLSRLMSGISFNDLSEVLQPTLKILSQSRN